MHNMTLWMIICTILTVLVVCGCASSFGEVKANPVADVFNTALKVAAKVLANEGTQKLAVAAAQAVVVSQLQEPAAQAAACSIVEAAVPKITTGLASVITHCTTRKAATEDKFDQYVTSEAFGQLILECTQEYDRATK